MWSRAILLGLLTGSACGGSTPVLGAYTGDLTSFETCPGGVSIVPMSVRATIASSPQGDYLVNFGPCDVQAVLVNSDLQLLWDATCTGTSGGPTVIYESGEVTLEGNAIAVNLAGQSVAATQTCTFADAGTLVLQP